MQSSRVKDGRDQDLELLFTGVIGVRWADEFYGSIVHPMTLPLPKCRNERWGKWVFSLDGPRVVMARDLPESSWHRT